MSCADLFLFQDSEKAKVIQSIASVIQALPPEQEIEPVDVCITELDSFL